MSKTVNLREHPNSSLKDLSKGDKIIIENGDEYIILHDAMYSDYYDAFCYPARTAEINEDNFYGYKNIFVMDDWTIWTVVDLCFWSEVTGGI